MKNSIFARFARAFFIFWHWEDVLVLSTTWNDLFCSCVDDVSTWWQMFNFVFVCPKQLLQFNSRRVRTHFLSIMTLNNWKLIAETRSYIFRWRSRFRRRRVCLSSLLSVIALRSQTLCAMSMSEAEMSFPREENSLTQRLAVSSADSFSLICATPTIFKLGIRSTRLRANSPTPTRLRLLVNSPT